MKELGYKEVSDSFLVKYFDNIQINITRRDNYIEAITGYINNEITAIPDKILLQVEKDIQQSL